MTTKRPTPEIYEYRCKDSWNVDVVSAKWADAKIAKLERQRDELLTALNKCVALINSDYSPDSIASRNWPTIKPIITKARAVLAAIEASKR